MNKKRNVTSVATTGDEMGKILKASSDDPQVQYSTPKDETQGKSVCEYLGHGEANAISSEALARIMGCSSVRQLQSIIAAERARGAVILSKSSGGYYLPADGEDGREEIKQYISTLRSRALNTLLSIKSARETLKTLDGQTQMEDTDEQGREEEVQ